MNVSVSQHAVAAMASVLGRGGRGGDHPSPPIKNTRARVSFRPLKLLAFLIPWCDFFHNDLHTARYFCSDIWGSHQILNFPGMHHGPRCGSLQRSPDPLSVGKGLAASSPRTPSPALGPSGSRRRPEASCPLRDKMLPSQNKFGQTPRCTSMSIHLT